MPDKLPDLLSCAIMVNDDADYKPLTITEDIMLDNDYEPGNLFLNFIYTNNNVVVNGQDESNFGDYENNEVVQEIYETDLNIEHSNNVWRHNSIRYLIYCWSQLREQFASCPDKKKKSLWQHVSERMVEHGFYFDAKACETKWRGLKKVYMYNKTRSTKKDGTKHIIVWTHYCDMDRAIKGIPYEISDDEDDEDNDVDEDDLRESADESCITTVTEYENSNTTSGRDGNNKICQWTIESTRELIRMYGKYRKKFSAVNQGGKHLLWEEIAQQFSQLGYNYSANACNDKWRNLKMTYKKNLQRATKYGLENIKWYYFKDINNIIKNPLEETSDLNDIITVSLNDEELEDVKKDSKDQFNIRADFQTPDDEITENNDGEENSSSLEIWTESATKCLIELWGLYRPRFLMAAQGKKRLLWNEISDQLRKNGHNYSGLICDRKWRLLKANYLKRKEKYKRLGVNNIKWQYYQDLDRLLGTPVETISWSMDSTMCLIDCFDHHKEKFMQAATGEKLLIWKQISDEMSQNGYYYSARACDNKWRTLKNRYNKNRMRSNRNKKVIWVYYNKIDSVLREINKEKNSRGNETNKDTNNQSCETNELDEHNYIKTKPNVCSFKTEAITELKDMITTKYTEFDQKFKEMEDDFSRREKVFVDLQQQTLNALNKSNELEAHKLRLLEQLISKLPNAALPQNMINNDKL